MKTVYLSFSALMFALSAPVQASYTVFKSLDVIPNVYEVDGVPVYLEKSTGGLKCTGTMAANSSYTFQCSINQERYNPEQIYKNLNVTAEPVPAVRTKLIFRKTAPASESALTCTETNTLVGSGNNNFDYECNKDFESIEFKNSAEFEL